MPTSRRHRLWAVAAAALLLTGLAACGSDTDTTSSQPDSTPSTATTGAEVSPSRSPSTTPASPQPSNPDIDLGKLSKWDRQLVQRLQKIGVNDAQPVEQGFRGSNVGGHDGTRYVSVSTTEQDVNYDADLVRTMRVQGVEVRVMKFGRTPDALHFNCDVLHYDVRKFEGPEAGDVDIEASHAFAERLITSLDCH